MKAEIISIGTELLMGELTDTNASFIASRLPPLGIQLQWVTQVGDNLDTLVDAFRRGLGRSDVIFTSGGLGPTQDDLTREAIARTLGEDMVVQEDLLEKLRGYFRGRGTGMPASNIKQATLIPSARSLPNPRGTAPGWWVEKEGVIIVAMPGPPAELLGMWDEEGVPRLRQRVTNEVIITRNIKTSGLSEGELDELVSQYLGKDNPYLGIYAKPDGIHLRIIARARNQEEAMGLISPVEQGLASLVKPYIWGYDDDTPERALGLVLTQKGLTLGTMEYCTGGLIASSITDVPNSGTFYKGGVVVFSRESALSAGLPPGIFEDTGIATREAAEAMALTARLNFESDIGVGVTGVAGPEEMAGQPVGSVHIAVAMDGVLRHFPTRFPPRQSVIRRRAVSTALIELRRMLDAE